MKQRLHIVIHGAVQGVGFRPFVYRLATLMNLPGWVVNSPQGVLIEVEGEQQLLEEFILRIGTEKPERSSIQSMETSFLDPIGYTKFKIRESRTEGTPTAFVLPDIATCPDCLAEILDRSNRRYKYPFTNCTNCGPRFTIIEGVPYDRPLTTMKHFTMCPACYAEYENPADRRFHAQPNACPECGPHLELWNGDGVVLATREKALEKTTELLLNGAIAAIKGLGGFHLVCDARNQVTVDLLRRRKHREEKPLAVMVNSLESAKKLCEINSLEERLLSSPEAPIVLLSKKNNAKVLADAIAPRNPYLGLMLPYTPLHHLLLNTLQIPIVATSGNLSDEPICIDEHEALKRLHGIADVFLVHNRPILRHADDSIVRLVMGRELVMRRARGFAPLPITLSSKPEKTYIAVGAHLKNTIAMNVEENVFISQHIGDLETNEAFTAFQNVISSFQNLYNTSPSECITNIHPEYLSTKYGKTLGLSVTSIQHHFAHVASCMAENKLDGEVLGIAWDGTGFGTDGTVWGGEFIIANDAGFNRVGTFRRFPLPGGEKAIREPRRIALGLFYAMNGDALFSDKTNRILQCFSEQELKVIQTSLSKNLNTPITSSVGRLFDGVASIINLRQITNYEGETAMELEFTAHNADTKESYRFSIVDKTHDIQSQEFKYDESSDSPIDFYVDWEPMIRRIVFESAQGLEKEIIAAKFHNTLVEIIVCVAEKLKLERVVLSGGCFQNQYLTERTILALREKGFRPYWHQRVPPNDGGIALGQIAAAIRMRK